MASSSNNQAKEIAPPLRLPVVRLLLRDAGPARLLIHYLSAGKNAIVAHDDAPAIAGSQAIIVSYDLMQLLPENEIDDVLVKLQRRSHRVLFIIRITFSDDLLDDGRNAHRSIHDGSWWRERLLRYFPLVEQAAIFDENRAILVTWKLGSDTKRRIERLLSIDKLRFKLGRRLQMLADKRRRRSARLTTEGELFEELAGRSVALIGNSTALAADHFGEEIDAHDIVVRLNRAPILHVCSHGRRTDWIAAGNMLERSVFDARRPRRLLWMPTKDRPAPPWMYEQGLFISPTENHNRLKGQIGARPSTGLIMIDILARSPCKKVTLYGFDFFTSLSVSGYRTVAQVPHDFGEEKYFVGRLIASDSRFTLRGHSRN